MNRLEPFYYKLRDFLKEEYKEDWMDKLRELEPHYELIKKFSKWRT